MQDLIAAAERLWYTAARDRLVPVGHPDAAFLYCTPGRQLLRDEATALGIAEDGTLAAAKPVQEPDDAPLDTLTRAQLEAVAVQAGVPEAAAKDARNKADLVGLIEAAAAQAGTQQEDPAPAGDAGAGAGAPPAAPDAEPGA